MKYAQLKKTIIWVAVILIIAAIFSRDPSMSSSSFAAEGTSVELARLLGGIGVLPYADRNKAIDFILKDINGRSIRTSDFKGNVLFINFWTTWCPDCRIEMPSLEKLHTRFKGKKFVMISVNLQETAGQVKRFFKKYGLTFIALLDTTGRIGNAMEIRTIPTTFIIDKNGKLFGTATGARKWDNKEAIALFEYLTNRKAAKPS